MATEEVDRLAERALRALHEQLLRARTLAKQKPYEKEDGEFGVENWRAISARNGLLEIARLRGFGSDWLSRQPAEVQREVEDAERELEHLRATAIVEGAHNLPVDLPDDPFPPTS